MDGAIEWSAVPFFAELYDVGDVELFARWLMTIRAARRRDAESAAPPPHAAGEDGDAPEDPYGE